jgi:hypothetical protein
MTPAAGTLYTICTRAGAPPAAKSTDSYVQARTTPKNRRQEHIGHQNQGTGNADAKTTPARSPHALRMLNNNRHATPDLPAAGL